MSDGKPKMQEAVRHLAEQLEGIRAGTLGVGLVETFRASFKCNSMVVGWLASVPSQGNRVVVTPFDPANEPAIVEALADARLNAYALDLRTMCVDVPPIAGRRRDELARHVEKPGEEAKVAIRSIRQGARKAIAARGRGSERAVQEATLVAEVERLVKTKTEDLKA